MEVPGSIPGPVSPKRVYVIRHLGLLSMILSLSSLGLPPFIRSVTRHCENQRSAIFYIHSDGLGNGIQVGGKDSSDHTRTQFLARRTFAPTAAVM